MLMQTIITGELEDWKTHVYAHLGRATAKLVNIDTALMFGGICIPCTNGVPCNTMYSDTWGLANQCLFGTITSSTTVVICNCNWEKKNVDDSEKSSSDVDPSLTFAFLFTLLIVFGFIKSKFAVKVRPSQYSIMYTRTQASNVSLVMLCMRMGETEATEVFTQSLFTKDYMMKTPTLCHGNVVS